MASVSLPLFCCCFFFSAVAAREYLVGDAVGWRIPAANETQLYNVWASRRRFHVGDSLRFRYKNNDSVVEVQKWGYYHCDPSTPIAFFNDGDTVVNLETVGMMYFISGEAVRCKQGEGMMLQVSPERVSHFPPSIASPSENPYSPVAPSPSEFSISGGSSGGSASSGSVTSFSVSVSMISVMVGVGLWLLKA